MIVKQNFYRLRILVPPVIKNSDQLIPEAVEAPIGSSVLLECVILRGHPKPTIEWRKGSRKIVPGYCEKSQYE